MFAGTSVIIGLGALATIASVVWLLIEKQSIPYVKTQYDPSKENNVVTATLIGVAGIVALAIGTVVMAFSA